MMIKDPLKVHLMYFCLGSIVAFNVALFTLRSPLTTTITFYQITETTQYAQQDPREATFKLWCTGPNCIKQPPDTDDGTFRTKFSPPFDIVTKRIEK